MNLSKDKIRVNRLHWPVTTLGFGKRIGVWLQGCSIHCPGCCSKDTWLADSSHYLDLEEVLLWVSQRPMEEVDGFTITGGEPLEQAAPLLQLIAGLRKLALSDKGRDILLYTGYTWEMALKMAPAVLPLADAVVSGPYMQGRPLATLRGSDNQRLSLLTDLAVERYGVNAHGAAGSMASIQLLCDGETAWMTGIPSPGDLETLKKRLKFSGIELRL